MRCDVPSHLSECRGVGGFLGEVGLPRGFMGVPGVPTGWVKIFSSWGDLEDGYI